MPIVSVINASTEIADAAVAKMIPAFDQQWNQDLEPVWRVQPATFEFVPKGRRPTSGSWWCVFLDDSDQAGALAYHDLTNEGLPLSKVFVRTLLKDNAVVSVGATHELCEMAVDPWLNGAYQDDNGVFWAAEVADPVEDDSYAYSIGGVLVTDFVTPTWFAHKFASAPYDLKGHAIREFEVLSGGYAQKFDPQSGWVQVTGSAVKGRLVANPALGSRRERRAKGAKNWYRSGPFEDENL